MTHYDLSRELPKRDAKTVLEIRLELIHAAGEHPCCSDTFNAAERALERAEARVEAARWLLLNMPSVHVSEPLGIVWANKRHEWLAALAAAGEVPDD